ncbi:type II toxin-antitoxin system RatA family toxin [Halapricum hydrolyticum]|uniref:SRPBCC family protein n=1 Tax=Halapricum hydrolyticum TaxID=2979991 RepID=A0AAE3ICC3_9EURY|nr:SRPBCC family protein [Halapricum hydrolyticum]MCU4718759.1 SRPBCC family protein [Halapricum hydrolyticum]MCU4727746.1 SRPBCC family protein [Halapricum hydrolyticum]
MDTIEVSTVVYRPKSDVYEFLVDFPRYAVLSEHLRDVRQDGDGSAGTSYRLHFAWWKLSYTAHSMVTDLDPPERIDWELTKDLDARGSWVLESGRPPEDRDDATRIRFVVHYDPHSAGKGTIDLPRFVSLGWVIEKVKPLVRREAERIVERLVAELEGESRAVELDIHTTPDGSAPGSP